MADPPASLRQADANIYKTAMRAEQLQSVKPIVAYWCDYWVLKQILAKGLHNTIPEVLEYSSRLMDKMEQTKSTHGTEDAINDDTAGQFYIEQFAQETLDRAQRVVKANKVTLTTANTFDAAATFFGLVNVWGPPNAETLQKIKYAKWNAARILKAVKDGNDPNESNPNPDDLPPQEDIAAVTSQDEMDDSVVSPGTGVPSSAPTAAARPVTIEDDDDDSASNARGDSAGISLPHSLDTSESGANDIHAAPSAEIPSLPSTGANPLSLASPTAPAPFSLDSSAGYPPPQSDLPAVSPFDPPTAPPVNDLDETTFHVPKPKPPFQQPSANVGSYFAGALPHQSPASGASGNSPQHNSRFVPQPSAPSQPPAAVTHVPPATIDDLAMVNAQKHAKWAISALNFEDVSTAVRELRKALEFLGAS
ncbi:hypothetical protein SEPCBS57363_005238 [Sporothrix epigloea]|uniref:Vacuolar protein sorting-associated protein VTA1 n=1 Tax=Sporothrix epigloea TaxID=1892477 RepID=A0ABP0DYD0_9PEZI